MNEEIKRVRRDMANVARTLRRMLLVLVLLLVCLGWVTYSGRLDVVHDQRAACRRGKADRSVTASALRAQAVYLELVLGAASVKQDVKTAASANQDAQSRAASSLESRTGELLNCTRAFPAPSVLPLP